MGLPEETREEEKDLRKREGDGMDTFLRDGSQDLDMGAGGG